MSSAAPPRSAFIEVDFDRKSEYRLIELPAVLTKTFLEASEDASKKVSDEKGSLRQKRKRDGEESTAHEEHHNLAEESESSGKEEENGIVPSLFFYSSEDRAVLTTQNESYGLRRIEYSNSILLMEKGTPPSSQQHKKEKNQGGVAEKETAPSANTAGPAVVVIEKVPYQFEVFRVKPMAYQLRQLLGERFLTLEELEANKDGNANDPNHMYSTEEQNIEKAYGGTTVGKPPRGAPASGGSKKSGGRVFTFTELLEDHICCSAGELRQALADLHAIQFNQHIRLLDPHLISQCIQAITLQWDAQDLSFDSPVQLDDLSDALPSFPRIALEVTCATFSLHKEEEKEKEAEDSCDHQKNAYRFDLSKLSRHVGKSILQSTPVLPVEEFMHEWSLALPRRLTSLRLPTMQDMLGESYVEGNSVYYFPAEELPVEPLRRIEEMFKKRKRWEGDSLLSYLGEVMETHGTEFDHWLGKHCREHRVAGHAVTYTLN